ncbi:MAG TPA: GNAT family N-acetyltransferase [Flavihumibacter sp.]|jgi:ribosomal protein S18 acetylase RimI-like enzyme
MKIRIEPLQSDQKGLLAALSRQTFFDTFYAHNTPEDMQLFMDEQFTTEQLEAEPDLPDNYFFIAWSEKDKPLGYMRLRYWENQPKASLPQAPSLEITRLYAVKEAIGKGVGKEMMQFALDFARSKNLAWVWLGVWEHNAPAIAFYRKWGFEKFGSHEFILGRDRQTDWLMAKELAGNR